MLSYVICRREDKERMWYVELTHALLNRGITCQFTGVHVVASLKQDYSEPRVSIFKTGRNIYSVKLTSEIHGDTFSSMASDLDGLDEIEFVNKVLACVSECFGKDKNED